jgi:hypothetical protein
MKKPYNDFAPRNGSTTDYLSLIAVTAGVTGLLTFLWFVGVIADTLISLIEMI